MDNKQEFELELEPALTLEPELESVKAELVSQEETLAPKVAEPVLTEEEKQILAEAGVEIPEETAVEVESAVEVEVEPEGEFEEAYAPESEEEDSKEV